MRGPSIIAIINPETDAGKWDLVNRLLPTAGSSLAAYWPGTEPPASIGCLTQCIIDLPELDMLPDLLSECTDIATVFVVTPADPNITWYALAFVHLALLVSTHAIPAPGYLLQSGVPWQLYLS